MKIKFLKDYQVKAAGGPLYKEGQVVNLPDSSAQHFLNKKRAEISKGDESAGNPEAKPIEVEAEVPGIEIPEAEAPDEAKEEKKPDTPQKDESDVPENKKEAEKKVKSKPLGTAKRGRPSKQASGSEFEQHRQDHPDGE